jgi:tetratricopeptide (TPR) repeat protein
MKPNYRFFFFFTVICFVFLRCSTEKNKIINRSYHGMTARYNGYFNANELMRIALTSYRTSLKEDFYTILPIEPLPNETEVLGMYPSIDTAIAKCTKVIQNHSMPSFDDPSKKKVEYNAWIDENWTAVGISSYYRRDYDRALKNFEFVKKFYKNDPTLYIAELWIAKSLIAKGDYSEATLSLKLLDDVIEQEEALKSKKKEDKKNKKKKDASKREEEKAKFPKKIKFEFEKTKADLELKKSNKEEAIVALETSLKYTKKRSDKARVHFILAQLYESTGKNSNAKENYTKVLKYNAPYPMHFTARIKRAFMGGDDKLEKELHKMLKDVKNSEFKDQIYYALADMELQKGNKNKGIEYLTLSAFYSTTNTRQKGMAYEKLGNMSFNDKNYVSAQKYYDSCSLVINDQYPNAEGIRNKAIKLADLVTAVEIASYEDSVQKIARLSEKDQVTFVENVIKKIKKDAENQKVLEAKRLVELQKNQNLAAQTNEGAGSKWYWNNAKTRSEGFDEFKKTWGIRENEDNWRRSDKISMASFAEESDNPDQKMDSVVKVVEDTLTVEILMSRLPLTDSAKLTSMNRLISALYDAGIIYKDQLMENEMAINQFSNILDRKVESDFNLLSAYQLYRIYTPSNPGKSEEQKEYIMNMYPNSDYANYLRDPDYFIKKKERDKLAEQDYLVVLDRYNRGLYSPVISKAEMVIENEKDNIFRSKFMLLKAMSLGQTSEDKLVLIPVLEQLVKEYPNTPEQSRATELLGVIKTGISSNQVVNFGSKSIYKYDESQPLYILVFLEEKQSSNTEKIKVSNFNQEFFSTEKLKLSSQIFTLEPDQSLLMIENVSSELKATEYIRVFKATRKHLLDLQKNKIIVISKENYKILYETKKLQEYEDFMLEYY